MALYELAAWVAPAATMMAAMMTASNLGARLTGWGFALFSLGSLGWVLVGLEGDQPGLVITNSFLTLVNAFGIWRWLGRQALYDAVGASAEAASHGAAASSVIAATGLAGRDVLDAAGGPAGKVVEAIVDCRSASIRQIVIRVGGLAGVGEHLVSLPIERVMLDGQSISTSLFAAELAALPHVDPETTSSTAPGLLEAPAPERVERL